MQATTGCKINVAPASGQDFRREIGLVGTRGSIDAAKRAIMDKVNAVVSFAITTGPITLMIDLFFRRKRIVRVEELIVMTNSMNDIHITSSSLMASQMQHHLKQPMQQMLLVKRIPMPPMVAIKALWPCGIPVCKPNKDNSKHHRIKAH